MESATGRHSRPLGRWLLETNFGRSALGAVCRLLFKADFWQLSFREAGSLRFLPTLLLSGLRWDPMPHRCDPNVRPDDPYPYGYNWRCRWQRS